MLTFDLSEFERASRRIGGAIDQVPYALSLALNEAARRTRLALIDLWPRYVEARKQNFIRVALQTEFATKRDLRVAIFDKLGRAHLGLHAHGGIKQARGRLAIPTKAVRRGASGVVQSQRPANLKRAVVKGNLIFQAQGRGKSTKLRLMYKLQPTARIKADVPFAQEFRRVMALEARRAFPAAMARALRTRR